VPRREFTGRRKSSNFRRELAPQAGFEPATLRLTAQRRYLGSGVLRTGSSDENTVVRGALTENCSEIVQCGFKSRACSQRLAAGECSGVTTMRPGYDVVPHPKRCPIEPGSTRLSRIRRTASRRRAPGVADQRAIRQRVEAFSAAYARSAAPRRNRGPWRGRSSSSKLGRLTDYEIECASRRAREFSAQFRRFMWTRFPLRSGAIRTRAGHTKDRTHQQRSRAKESA
jgi:hypothetical protein